MYSFLMEKIILKSDTKCHLTGVFIAVSSVCTRGVKWLMQST